MKKTIFIPVLVITLLIGIQGAFAIEIDTPSDGGSITSKPASFTGTAAPNADISLKEDGDEIATTTADSTGEWSISTSNVSSGEHTYTATETYDSKWAFMDPGIGGSSVDVVDVTKHEFVETVSIDEGYTVNDLEVNDGVLFILGTDYETDTCKVFAFSTETLEPATEDGLLLEDDCQGINFDVDNSTGLAASVLYYQTGLSEYRVAALNIENWNAIAYWQLGDDFNGPINTVMISGGETVIVNYGDGLEKFVYDDPDFVLNDSQSHSHNAASPAVALEGDGSIIYGDVNGNIVERQTATLSNYVEHPVSENAIQVVGATRNNGAFYGLGWNGSNYSIFEWGTGLSQILNTINFDEYPESFSVDPDGDNWIIGDDHSAGIVYFGEVEGDEIVDTIQNDGASYNMSGDRWITDDETRTFNTSITTTNVFANVVNSFGDDAGAGINSKTVAPGETIDVSGSGYQANSDVTITLHSTPVLLKTLKTNSSGAFSTQVTIPSNTPLGNHNLVIDGTNASAISVSSELSLTVASLPRTGNSSKSNALFALMLIGAGLILIQARRMSTKRSSI